ncbi:hypothetical protein BC941DRAFT_350337 [Chlamydoabsidia padenii]|nr:hypothetical protein BC941DRAFT_350337 [Chlamydoabsidia padenii]
MSDKPLVQQALANDLGALILDVPEDNVIPFIKAFWLVHCAEWHGLDRIRLDKYLLLFRRVIFYSFAWLANNNWDEEKVNAYTDCLLKVPLHPTDRTKPDAIVYHIMEVYYEELRKVIDAVLNDEETDQDNLPELPMDELMRPIIVLSTDALNKTTRKKAKAALLEIETASDDDEDLAAMDDSDDMEEDSE